MNKYSKCHRLLQQPYSMQLCHDLNLNPSLTCYIDMTLTFIRALPTVTLTWSWTFSRNFRFSATLLCNSGVASHESSSWVTSCRDSSSLCLARSVAFFTFSGSLPSTCPASVFILSMTILESETSFLAFTHLLILSSSLWIEHGILFTVWYKTKYHR